MYKKMNNIEKIEKIIFEDSSKEYHIRLIARLTGLNPNTVISVTDNMLDVLTKNKDKDTNRVIIRARQGETGFKIKKKFYNIRKIYGSGLVDFLNDKLSYPTIVLFGSYAKAENRPESDIDLFIVCDEKRKLNLSDFEELLGAEIQLFIHTKEEFGKMKKQNKELVNNVINGYVMSGYLEVL